MAIIIETIIPEECPADIPEERLKQELETGVRERLKLNPQDKVLISFRETNSGGKGKYNKLHKKESSKHKEYCSDDCSICEGTTGEANVWIARGKGR